MLACAQEPLRVVALLKSALTVAIAPLQKRQIGKSKNRPVAQRDNLKRRRRDVLDERMKFFGSMANILNIIDCVPDTRKI